MLFVIIIFGLKFVDGEELKLNFALFDNLNDVWNGIEVLTHDGVFESGRHEIDNFLITRVFDLEKVEDEAKDWVRLYPVHDLLVAPFLKNQSLVLAAV